MTTDSNSELESQRRSRRLYAKIQVRIDWNLDDQSLISEEAETVVVSAHGALVRLDSVPLLGQMVTVQNPRTNEIQEAVVAFLGKVAAKDGKFSVGVEFTNPNASFWRVSFPPEDWSRSHPDAKK